MVLPWLAAERKSGKLSALAGVPDLLGSLFFERM